jgi:3-oxosteroid 1-dehydrogenase
LLAKERYDFVCLGAGIGGLTGALRAHDLGLSVIVLEKSDQVGGTAAYSSGQQWVAGSYVEEEAGIEDSWEEGFRFLTWLAGGTADPTLLEKFCRTAPQVYEFLGREAGVRWCIFDIPDNGWPDAPGSKKSGRCTELEVFDGKRLPEGWRHITRHSPYSRYSNNEMYHELGGLPNRHTWDPRETKRRTEQDLRFQGSALAAYFVSAIADRDIPMHVNVENRALIVEDGRAAGVVVAIDGEERRVLADRGVLIATGGYDWSPDLVKQFDGRNGFGSRAPQSVTGDHFALMEPLEPKLATVSRPHNLGYREPGEISIGGKDRWQSLYTSYPHAILVNRFGKRFTDESTNSSKSETDNMGEPINTPCFAILDSQYRKKYQVGVVRPGEPLPAAFVEAQSLGELADELGIDPAGLEETVATYNENVRRGVDPDFNRGTTRAAQIRFGDPWMKPNPSLGPLEEPPFYGVSLSPVGVSLTQTGFVTDEYARVVDTHGKVIAGIYAVGNAAAYLDVGSTYHPGTANTRGMTWAYVAAEHAAGFRVPEPAHR